MRSLGFLLLLFPSLLAAEEKDVITWGIGHHPPRVILDEHQHLSGQGGIQQLMLEAGLAEYYQHKHVVMNWARFEKELTKGSKMCSSFVFKTPKREAVGEFSLPWHIDLPFRVILRPETFKTLGSPEKLSVLTLVNNPRMTGMVETGRSFGNLDKLLFTEDSHLRTLATEPNRVLPLLLAGRMDYTFEYPYVISYMQQAYGHNQRVHMVPIEEVEEFYFTRVACPSNEWGKQVIARVNDFIRNIRDQRSYLEVLQMIHHNARDRNLVNRVYKEQFVHAAE